MSKAVHKVSGLKGLLFLPAHSCLGDPLDQYQLENAAITSSVNKENQQKITFKSKKPFILKAP